MMNSEHAIGNIRTKKAVLRKEMLAKRRAMSKEECDERSRMICENFLKSSDYKNADSILLYKAYNNEVDTDMIFSRALSDGKIVAYPRSAIVGGEPDLCFYVINDLTQLKAGFMGIEEPDEKKCKVFEGKADICIAPGVAFDRKCHRIGYGKAFYDTFITKCKPSKIIGLAYEIQISDDIEPEESDRAVDAVMTESVRYGI